MTVCFFGNYISDYSRVRVLRKGFQQNNFEVLECHTRKKGFKKYLELYKQHKKVKNKYDILLVMMGGQTLVWFAKLISNKKIIFDAFTSLYLTNVEDRKICSSKSFKAKYYAWLDKSSCKKADKILLDTQAQINYFVEKYKLNKNKFIRVFVGSENDCGLINKNNNKFSNKFIVHWHGYIVPFYSLETIIKSAKILEKYKDIEFQIVTRFNSKYENIKNLSEKLNLKNIKFFPETDYQGVFKFINQADICLGIFGDNKKAQVVIPNKIYEAVACAKPIITVNHKVLNELFIENKNIILVNSKDEKDLANKILELKNNKELRNKISQNLYKLYQEKLTPQYIVQQIIKIFI